jgi:hypothetical protein
MNLRTLGRKVARILTITCTYSTSTYRYRYIPVFWHMLQSTGAIYLEQASLARLFWLIGVDCEPRSDQEGRDSTANLGFRREESSLLQLAVRAVSSVS